MYVRAVVEEGIAADSFLVPQRAVSRNRKGEPTALFVGADDKVEERVLEVRRSVGSNWLVSAGVSAGDRVIVEGLQRVRAGRDVDASEVTIDEATGEVHAADSGEDLGAASRAARNPRPEERRVGNRVAGKSRARW